MWIFLTSPLGRKLSLAAVIFALLAGMYFYAFERGTTEGKTAGAREQLETDRSGMQSDRKQFLEQLNHLQGDIDEAAQRETQAQAARDAANSQLVTLISNRARDTAKVAAIPDEELVADIQTHLGDTPSADKTLHPSQLRKIDVILVQTANTQDQLTALEAALKATDARVVAQGDELKAVAAQRDGAIAFGNKMVQHYTVAYNAAQKKHSTFVKVISLGIVRDRHLDLPDPATLKTSQ